MAFSLLSSRTATPSTTDARYADFLDDGLNPSAQAPVDPRSLPNPNNPGGVSDNELFEKMVADREKQNSLPYGTPISQGGTATQFEVTTSQNKDLFPRTSVIGKEIGANGPTGFTTGATYEGADADRAMASARAIDNKSAYGSNVVTPAGTAPNGAPARPALVTTPPQSAPLAAGFNNQGAFFQPPTDLQRPGNYTAPPMDRPYAVSENGAAAPGQVNPGYVGDKLQGTQAGQSPAGQAASGGGTPGAPGAGGSIGARPQAQQAIADAAQLATIGAGRGPGGAAPRLDLANADVKSFLDEERARKGPSEAEALLAKATDRVMAQSLAVASGARGTAEDRSRATRSAISANAATGAQATQDVATLRAQEEQQRRQRMLQELGLQGSLSNSADQLGLGYTQAGAQLYGQGLNSLTTLEGGATTERIAANDRAWREYMYGNLSASEREAYRQAELNKPSFGEQAVSTGLSLLPAAKSLKDLVA